MDATTKNKIENSMKLILQSLKDLDAEEQESELNKINERLNSIEITLNKIKEAIL